MVATLFIRLPNCLLVALFFCFQCAGGQTLFPSRGGLDLTVGATRIELAPATSSALRLSFSCDGQPVPAPSLFLDASATHPVPWHRVRQDDLAGIQTRAGRILVSPKDGRWLLQNTDRKTLIISRGINFRTGTNGSDFSLNVTWEAPSNVVQGVYGSGNGHPGLLQHETHTQVANGLAVIPYFWSPAGYAILAVSADDNQPASWSLSGGRVTWNFPGKSADLYLMPANSLAAAAEAYAQLTGRAPVPPRWAFGYLQSRWGWKDRAYLEDVLQQFRQRQIPVDAFICDFEWYTPKPDYEVSPQGAAGFSDFGWNTNLFPEPARQIKQYQDAGVRFVGIRKPRLGNPDTLAMTRRQGWMLANEGVRHLEKFQSRDMDFSNPDFRTWYVSQTTNLLAQGVDGWWNDEGEAAYTTYYYWNLAEAVALSQVKPNHRLWTLNRAFSPGLQRLGAAAWTGDIRSTWKVLAETPVSLLNWSLAGMPYSGCDIGGYDGDADPSPELLVRWMEAGVFFPIMRSHSALNRTPRFPWLFGPEAENAIRQAIELRYRLIPFYYSLAHQTFETGLPIMRPLVMEFPHDGKTVDLSAQWLMGSSILVAPVLNPGGNQTIYLPADTWYVFGTNLTISGPRTIGQTVPLDKIPVYVRAGTILPLGPVAQHTGLLCDGDLELQIYPGKNATFTLVEDDGETTAYINGEKRCVTFKWDESTGRLSWTISGSYHGSHVFKSMRVTLFDHQSPIVKTHSLAHSARLDMR